MSDPYSIAAVINAILDLVPIYAEIDESGTRHRVASARMEQIEGLRVIVLDAASVDACGLSTEAEA